jgi:methyl-accepting chemotaxis protein
MPALLLRNFHPFLIIPWHTAVFQIREEHPMASLRLLLRPLFLLRDLPIGVKLVATTAGALALLAGISWFSLDRLTVIGALQDGVAEQAARADTVQRSLLAAQELRVVSRELQYLQTAAGVHAAEGRAEQQHAVARQALQHARATSADPTEQALLDQALTRLDTMADAVKRAAGLRADMISARQKRLFQARTIYETSLNSLTTEVAQHGVELSGVDSVRSGGHTETAAQDQSDPTMVSLNTYRIAMARLQTAALMFLATGNPSAANEVKDAAAESNTAMAAILNGDAPGTVKSDAKMVEALGGGIASAAVDLIAQSRNLERMTQQDVETASKAMQAAIQQVATSVAAHVKSASLQANAARRQAERDVTILISLLAGVMLVLGSLTTWAIAGPIRALTKAVRAIAGGDTATPVEFQDWRDETGRMAVAVEALRGVMRQTFLQSQMIEQIPVGVMTAAAEGEFAITYMNLEARHLLEAVQEHLPMPPDRLLGQSMTIFYPDRDQQTAVVADPANLPHRTRLVMGDETLEVTVNALRDRHGAYAGPLLIWRRLTNQAHLVHQFEESVGAIAGTVGESAAAMHQSAQSMTGAAEDSARRIAAVTEASAAASGHVAAAAGGAEELAASVAEIGRQVAESARIANQAVREAEATDQCVGGLSEAAGRIGDVVRLIGDIASQTNLLALNATIEAARAGEAGKGFAVVAGEVKALATQTARATQEIDAQINGMRTATSQAVTALRSIGATIQRMNEIATAIASAVEEQGAATQEIARSVQQAAVAAGEVDGNLAAVSKAVTDTGSRAESVLAAAGRLSEEAVLLRTESDGFLAAVQQAA